MSAALAVIALVVLLALLLGLRARGGREMTLEQWTVGGRGFGSILVCGLMAGEIYTTFTFLGGSGWAYGRGAPAYYILGYGALAYIISYWLLPAIWRYAKAERLISQPDFFARKYGSPALGLLVSVVGVVALIPYMVLQLKGLGIIVATASYGAIGADAAVWIGAAVVTAYVTISGVHGSAWTAVIKDILILAVVLFLGIYLPLHLYGGYGAMFSAIQQAKPDFLALPPKGQGIAWFDSTVLLTALGFYCWPHSFAACYTARSERAFRQNAIVLPLYQLILLFVFFVGFAAILQVPGLKGGDIDLSLFRLSLKVFDPWFVGVIGAAGVLTALVPGSLILTSAAALIANNLYRPARRDATDGEIALVARITVPVLALIAVLFTLGGGTTIVSLLLMGYSFVTQLFPSLVASFLRRNFVTPAGAFAGICVGVATVAATTLTGATVGTLFPGLPEGLQDLNVGIVALALNLATLLVVSAVTRGVRRPSHA
jgi:solute:Na+ symporter, SSS family